MVWRTDTLGAGRFDTGDFRTGERREDGVDGFVGSSNILIDPFYLVTPAIARTHSASLGHVFSNVACNSGSVTRLNCPSVGNAPRPLGAKLTSHKGSPVANDDSVQVVTASPFSKFTRTDISQRTFAPARFPNPLKEALKVSICLIL